MKLLISTARITANGFLYISRIAWIGLLIFIGYLVYRVLVVQILDGQRVVYPFIALWVLTSYIVIPRIHRFLTKIYIPDYFVGRTKRSDGFYSDPINLAFIVKNEQTIHRAMQEAGWVLADPGTVKNILRASLAIVFKKSYPTAPVGTMFLFGRKQAFCYQQEVNGSPRARHHVRFWKTPKYWRLPGGHKTDWLAAGTYDRSIGFSGSTFQLDHKISGNIDEERDYIVKSLKETEYCKEVEVVKHFTTAYHTTNGGGDRINTDGSLPFIHLV